MRERAIFLQAQRIKDEEQRLAFLRDACGEDAQLIERIKRLLSAADSPDNFLEPEETGDYANKIDFAIEKDRYPKAMEDDDKVAMSRLDLSFLQAPQTADSIGRIDHYDVIEVLGFGAFGIVFKAHDTKLRRDVAIKTLMPHLAIASPPRKRFLREARACAAIHHPNVVSVHDVNEEPVPYLVMEFIHGQTLQSRIENAGPLDSNEILSIILQLSEALCAAHQQGLIHRDIKPSNILLQFGNPQRVVITDFGLARTVDDASLTQSGYVAGTPMYMSPEQASGGTVDVRSDLFSLGSVLYLMITGRPPFRAQTSAAVMHRVINTAPRAIAEILPETPEWLVRITERLHEKRSEDRFQTANDLRDILLKVQDETRSSRGVSPGTIHEIVGKQALESNVSQSVAHRFRSRRLLASLFTVTVLGLAILAFAYARWGGVSETTAGPTTVSVPSQANASLPTSPEKQADSVDSREELGQVISGDAPPMANAPFNAATATKLQQEWADYLGVPVNFTHRTGLEFCLIPPGTFVMGSNPEDIKTSIATLSFGDPFYVGCINSESPPHRVQITKPFYMARTELTESQFEQVMSYNPRKYWTSEGFPTDEENLFRDNRLPISILKWDEAAEFCRTLNRCEEVKSGEHLRSFWIYPDRGYSLATEAQWEFACRAGTTTRFWTGDEDSDLQAKEQVFQQRDDAKLQVAKTTPNPFGIYDMHGNVREFVFDRWGADYYSDIDNAVDPKGVATLSSPLRVIRGGDFYWSPTFARSGARFAHAPESIPPLATGVRLVVDVETARKHINAPLEPLVRDYRVARGVSINELQAWIDELGTELIPMSINLRHGAVPARFDAVAVDNRERVAWHVDVLPLEEIDSNFEQYRTTHAPIWRTCVPLHSDVTDLMIRIWKVKSGEFMTWYGAEDENPAQVISDSYRGFLPVSLESFFLNGELRRGSCQVLLPGVGHHTFFKLSPEELFSYCEQLKESHWRPDFIQIHNGYEEACFATVFRENSSLLKWDLSFNLTPAELEMETHFREQQHMYPASLASYVVGDGDIRYLVLWHEFAERSEGPK